MEIALATAEDIPAISKTGWLKDDASGHQERLVMLFEMWELCKKHRPDPMVLTALLDENELLDDLIVELSNCQESR